MEFDFLLDLMQRNNDWRAFENRWRFNFSRRVQINVSDGESPIVNAKVELLDERETVIFQAQTDNKGVAYVFNNINPHNEIQAASIRVSTTLSVIQDIDPYITQYDIVLPNRQQAKSLDLMLVIDTTGSMSDELEFLKAELDDIIRQVKKDNANIPVRLSVNVYRDIGDEYVVRSMPFGERLNEQLDFLNAQSARGGGDFEEAVEMALADALDEHDWNEEAMARILLLVLDAPPHYTESICTEMHRLTLKAAEMGVRIIPVASSGIDKNTEFILRSLSIATGGTYTFLTDHSGVGNPHLEPTIGEYNVELLNDLLVRLINGYLQ